MLLHLRRFLGCAGAPSRSVVYVARGNDLRPHRFPPLKRGRDTFTTVLDQNCEQLLDSCIREFYLRPERPSLAALIQEVRRQFSEQQLPASNYRTERRRVQALDLQLVIQKREG